MPKLYPGPIKSESQGVAPGDVWWRPRRVLSAADRQPASSRQGRGNVCIPAPGDTKANTGTSVLSIDWVSETCFVPRFMLILCPSIFISVMPFNCKHYFANKGPSSQSYVFSIRHVWMWELDYKESWAPKNWCFWTVMLEKTLESPLDCKEIQPVHSEGDQSWIFTRRNDAEAETPVLWPPDAKNWLIGKDPVAGKDWRQEEKGTTEDEMVGWHHRLDGHEFE